MAELRIFYTPATQPGEVTIVSTEDRVASEAARDAAIAARDQAVAAEGTFTAPGDEVIAGLISTTGTSETKTALSLPLNAKAYGAVGDGVADDTTEIQAALDAAETSLTSHVVLLPDGVYLVTALTIPSGVTLRGDGAVVKAAAGSTAPTINIPPTATGARIENVEVDGNAANQTTEIVGIDISGPQSRVTGCYVHDVKSDGILVTSNWVNVESCRVMTTGRYGITIQGTTPVPAENIVIHGNQVEDSNDGALGILGVGHHIVFSSNTTRDHGGDGIAAYNAANQDVTCVGNTFHNPGNHAIHLGGTRLVISDNTAHDIGLGNGYFLRNHDDTIISDATITGNTVTTTTAASSVGVLVQFVEDVTITGNAVTATISHGIFVNNSNRVTVTGNSVRSAGGNGILTDIVDDIVLTGNVVSAATAHGFHVNRTNRVGITGNSVRSAGAAGIRVEISTFAAITGNLVTGSVAESIYSGSNATGTSDVTVIGNVVSGGTYGVRTVAASVRWTVRDNLITGWVTARLSLDGATNNSDPQILDGTAAPTTGAWLRGDQVRHTAPAAGGNIGWVCVTAGTPGTWKSYGTIAA